MQLSTLGPGVYFDHVESGVGSWFAASPWAITTEWQPSWLPAGNHSWSDSPSGDYANNAEVDLVSPQIDLSGQGASQSVYLVFSLSCALQEGEDFVYVSFWDGSDWAWYGDQITGNYSDAVFITQVPAGFNTNKFKFCLTLDSDESVRADGIHVDEIELYAAPTREVQDDSANVAYLGSWVTGWLYGADGSVDNYKSSGESGDLVRLSFTGSAVSVMGRMGPDCGIAEISLDGALPQEVDYYWDPKKGSAYWQEAMTMFSVDGLSDGPHIMTMRCTGEKNPSSTGYAVSVERFLVWGAETQAYAPLHAEETDGNLEYVGPWLLSDDTSASDGRLLGVDCMGSSVAVEFDGTYLAWNAKTGPGYGKAKVSLDGGALQTVDLYSASDSPQTRVYETGLIADGPHTLSIYCAGEKNSSASGVEIDVDSFDVYESLESAAAAPTLQWRCQQQDSHLTYVGDWTSSGTDGSASGGSYVATSQVDAAVLAAFNGTSVKLVARTAPWCGKAEVILDEGTGDENVTTVDLYSSTVTYGVPVYTKTRLADGEHTLSIRCTGAKAVASSGIAISLDAMDIAGNVLQSPPVAVHEQDFAGIHYEGPWVQNVPSPYAASGWSYSYAGAPGCSMNLTFEGRYLEWIVRTTPWSGMAKVVLDPGTPGAKVTTVDTWSVSDKHKQRVYNTGLLADGTHTLAIYYTGDKRAASWSNIVYTDAFKVLGTASLTEPAAAPPLVWRYEQGDTRLTRVGDWTTGVSPSASGGSYISSSQPGAAVFVTFTGTTVTPVLRTTPWYGKAKLILDGNLAEAVTVDLYSPSVGWKVTSLYTKTVTDGVHTLVIENASTYPAKMAIGVDAFDITGYVDQAQGVTKVDDKDYTHFTYTPGIATGASTTAWSRWDASGYWAAYQDTYAYTDQVGYKATLTFNGRYAAWLACTSNTKGKAMVSLYEGTVDPANLVSTTEVDLYSPTTVWKKPVYSTGLLTSGTYVIEIECLGTKNPASWYHTIDVDRFDVLLAP